MNMQHRTARVTGHILSAALLAASLSLAAMVGDAVAQNVVVFVNGEPITAIDIEQRAKFIRATSQKSPPRQEVLDQLIDEKLKVREAKRWGMEITDKEVENRFAAMASNGRLTPDQLTKELARSGVNVSTLKSKIRADLVWQQLVRGRYQSRLQLSDREIVSALETKSPGALEAVGYEYHLRPILFLVPPGSAGATYDGRRREADALRGRFRGCDESIPSVRAMRSVVVRDPVVRSSADLPEGLRKILDSIPVGQLTAPEVTRHGIELFAICAKHESKSDTPSRRQARETMMSKRFEAESQRYLRELRRHALIERGR